MMLKKRIVSALCLCMALVLLGGGVGKKENVVSVNAQLVSEQNAESQSGVQDQGVVYRRWADSPLDSLARLSAEELEQRPELLLAREAEQEEEESEYAHLAIAHVDHYVNVRSNPDTESEILGKIYNGAVAEIIETAGDDEEWFHVTSGSVEGYIKAEFFIYGQDAVDVIDDYVTRRIVVKADRLNVRSEADLGAKRIGYLDRGEKALLLENCGEWMRIKYSDEKEGYVAAEYVTVAEEFLYAKSIEEERAEREALRALQRRQEASEESAPENTYVAPPSNNYATNEELRAEIVNYSMQFLGNKYVHGGNSLTKGTDCSGFTSLIYAEFGYSIGRTPSSQYSSAGQAIDYSQIQPGDIICYSSNGGKSCTHVALYIGDGQVIHEANSRKGVVIYKADYDKIIGVRNVID